MLFGKETDAHVPGLGYGNTLEKTRCARADECSTRPGLRGKHRPYGGLSVTTAVIEDVPGLAIAPDAGSTCVAIAAR